jgi:hypothetical protein
VSEGSGGVGDAPNTKNTPKGACFSCSGYSEGSSVSGEVGGGGGVK